VNNETDVLDLPVSSFNVGEAKFHVREKSMQSDRVEARLRKLAKPDSRNC